MAEQFDVSALQKQVLLEKAKRRTVLREEFLKQTSNPFRHASGEGGAVFDPAIQRHNAMRINTFEHFRPTFKNVRFGMMLIVVPFVVCGYIVQKDRTEKEAKRRAGLVAYADRDFKFI
ncbi:PREDICTED: uncharacterized protein LOC108563268 [Nicrophorus vespilloides]|uniref:NADH dehydrogenase [ubiquinone] 1 beta subcomplex subunit 4 n=1 Tax=Nicrophorus vespilloides TaxID=110193 RepID=A0ABM1MS32_NICVS|nr:PREDICTED: uncharacterized protein LOC108563268 [Nicrophorus vespilloides]